MKKNDIAIIVVNVADKFDTSMYSFLAPVMGPIFFPEYDFVVQLIFIYATSFTSLVARPSGAFFFGMLAYRSGPVAALLYSVMGVAVMTLVIGCIPGYKEIGWYAPFLLVVVRLMRGVCAAGECAVAKLYIMAEKDNDDALKASYAYQCSSMIGIIIASAFSGIIITTYPYLWRYSFIFAGVITAIVFCMRSIATPKYDAKLYMSYTRASLLLLIKKRVQVTRIAVVTVFSHLTYAVPFVFMNNFIPLITDISLSVMMKYNTRLLIFDMFMIPVVGYITQKYNAKKMMLCASYVLACTVIPAFYFLSLSSLWYVMCVRMWIVLWGVVFLCPLNFWCKNLIDTSASYFLVGMANAIGTATLGHITTPICLWLWYITGWVCAPAIYITVIIILTIWAVMEKKEKI